MDDKPVVRLSTVHGIEPQDTYSRWSKKENKQDPVLKPAVIAEYNSKMGVGEGLTRNHMLSYYRMSSHTKK